ANMVGAALRLTPPFAVIDLGTATVISVAGKSGELLGTVIAPGVGVSVKALSSSAAALPDVSLSVPGSVIGRNTEESMKSGAVLGWASMIDGLIDRIMDEKGFDRMDLIACGGFASQVIPYCKREIPVAESLTTDGLARIYKLNLRTGRK
ncbi:MAG: type III pantothenate kinase, partial [Clostridia bacterium]|nr:type III pantothenate kinase [Clostridia bacterium]